MMTWEATLRRGWRVSRRWRKSDRKKIISPPIAQGQRVRVPTVTGTPPGQLYPAFSLVCMDRGRYGLDACELREKSDFADALYKRSQFTWNELQSAPKHGLGSEKLPQDRIRAGIPAHVTPDVTLLAFRFSGQKAMVGYRQERIFYVVWLDRDFTLYDHGS